MGLAGIRHFARRRCPGSGDASRYLLAAHAGLSVWFPGSSKPHDPQLGPIPRQRVVDRLAAPQHPVLGSDNGRITGIPCVRGWDGRIPRQRWAEVGLRYGNDCDPGEKLPLEAVCSEQDWNQTQPYADRAGHACEPNPGDTRTPRRRAPGAPHESGEAVVPSEGSCLSAFERHWSSWYCSPWRWHSDLPRGRS
jgi:hypothetical protein